MAQTVLITGAAGAIASVVAPTFAEAGWQLALFDYGPDNAAHLRERYPEAQVADVDLTDEVATRQAVDEVLAACGSIDAVLNIAGGFGMQAAAEATQRDLERQFGINFFSLFNTTRAVLPGMLERGKGFLLGVSAAPALEGGAQMALYAASKAAVAAYLKSLQAEVGSAGIRVSVLYPMGAVDTPANRESMPDADPNEWIDREELAASILHLAARGRRGHVRELKVYAQ